MEDVCLEIHIMKKLIAAMINTLTWCLCFILLVICICISSPLWVCCIFSVFAVANLILSTINFKEYVELDKRPNI